MPKFRTGTPCLLVNQSNPSEAATVHFQRLLFPLFFACVLCFVILPEVTFSPIRQILQSKKKKKEKKGRCYKVRVKVKPSYKSSSCELLMEVAEKSSATRLQINSDTTKLPVVFLSKLSTIWFSFHQLHPISFASEPKFYYPYFFLSFSQGRGKEESRIRTWLVLSVTWSAAVLAQGIRIQGLIFCRSFFWIYIEVSEIFINRELKLVEFFFFFFFNFIVLNLQLWLNSGKWYERV